MRYKDQEFGVSGFGRNNVTMSWNTDVGVAIVWVNNGFYVGWLVGGLCLKCTCKTGAMYMLLVFKVRRFLV